MANNGNRRHVVVAGAGVAGLETVLALRAFGRDVVSVEVVAPEREFTYRPMAVAEPFHAGEVRRFPLDDLVRAAGAELRPGTLAAVHANDKTIVLADGTTAPYDVLVLALGTREIEAVPGALTFPGPTARERLEALLERATTGTIRRIVFTVPAGAGWPLPMYELALLAADHLVETLTRGVEVLVATPERRPLELFGETASDAIAELLEIRGIRTVTSSAPLRFVDGVLQLSKSRRIEADAVVCLPRLEGVVIDGVPHDTSGFVATDEFGWVLGLTDVYAAGDLAQGPVKQGGVAAQQADAAAIAIAADAGAPVHATAVRPVVRGLLLTGMAPRYIRGELSGSHRSTVSIQPLWWPPAKIVGRHLGPFLAEHLGLARETTPPAAAGSVPVEVAVERRDRSWSSL